jgi:acetyltransferase-like isoleucine patch superfamily enzyme
MARDTHGGWLVPRAAAWLDRTAGAVRLEAVEWYRAVLRAIPGEIGCRLRRRLYGFRGGIGTRVLSDVIIYYPENLVLGRDVGIAAGCQLNAGGGIEIGDSVLIGPGAIIWSQNHGYESPFIKIKDQGFERARVVIGEDVWIGAGSIVLPGVHLAAGTVVAAGSVVTKSTGANTVVGGVPARVLKHRSPGIGTGESDPADPCPSDGAPNGRERQPGLSPARPPDGPY